MAAIDIPPLIPVQPGRIVQRDGRRAPRRDAPDGRGERHGEPRPGEERHEGEPPEPHVDDYA